MENHHQCPLCKTTSTKFICRDVGRPDLNRRYHYCINCDLIFVQKEDQLSLKLEKARYDTHRNSPEDSGYRKFLSRMMNPMMDKLSGGEEGLDFGSGPGPTLSLMFQERGFPVSNYDPFYAPESSVLEKQYDFITATEVFEHFSSPADEIDLIWSLLKPGGYLGIMTKLWSDLSLFSSWHYKNDETHITFYSKKSFDYIAHKLSAQIQMPSDDIIILKK
jgi:hypothetical protein